MTTVEISQIKEKDRKMYQKVVVCAKKYRKFFVRIIKKANFAAEN